MLNLFFLLLLAAGVADTPAALLRIGLSFTSTTRATTHTRADAPDVNGAVGPNHIVEFLNGDFKVYDKKGKLLLSRTSQEFWAAAPGSGGAEANPDNKDPRLVYDAQAQRWYTSAQRPAMGDTSLVVGRSDSADPTSGWKAVTFYADEKRTPKTFADFDVLGYNRDGVYMSINQFNIGDDGRPRPNGLALYAMKKSDLNLPTPVLTLSRHEHLNDCRSVSPAIDYDGESHTASFWGQNQKRSDVNDLYLRSDLKGDWGAWDLQRTPTLVEMQQKTRVTPPLLLQPEEKNISSNGAQPGPIRLIQGEFWLVHAVGHPDDPKRTAVRWWRIRASDNTVLGDGILADPNLSFFNASIAADKSGNVVIGASGVGTTQFLSAYAIAGRVGAGNRVTFDKAFTLLKAGQGVRPNSIRWGDYTTTVADPSEPGVFWTFQSYALSNGDWATEITQLKVVP